MNQQISKRSAPIYRIAVWCLTSMLGLAACGGGGGGGGGGGTLTDLSAGLAAPAVVTPGATLTYTVTFGVTGAAANAVTATLTIPATVTGAVISDGGTLAGNQVSWPAIATVAVGTTTTHTVAVTVPSIGPLDATLQVATTSPESTNANNTANSHTVLGFDVLATVSGEGANDNYGWVADSVGDITGDGRPDFIVGAPFNDGAGPDAGRAYVYSGATAAQLFTFDGLAARDTFGWAVAAAGDVDGDGTGDIVVGGPSTGPAPGPGVARVLSGATGAVIHTLTGPANGARYGSAVAGIGDVNGDGRADVLIGAEAASGGVGQAFVISGMTGATIRTHTGSTGTNYGYGLGGLGDVSGDGVPDYGIGGGLGVGGLVEVRSGATGALLYTATPDASGNTLGNFWVDSVGDVNADGRPDFYAGDIGDSGGRGRGYLFSGADGTVLQRFTGQVAGDTFGISRNGGFDVDGDAIPDLFIAGYHNAEGAANGGKAYVYSGATGALLRTMTGVLANQALGFDAIQLGDVDGDGLIDYLLTSDQETGAPGTAIVVRGTTLP